MSRQLAKSGSARGHNLLKRKFFLATVALWLLVGECWVSFNLITELMTNTHHSQIETDCFRLINCESLFTTHSSVLPSSWLLGPVFPPVLWYSCWRWRWLFHGNRTPLEEGIEMVLPAGRQQTKYLFWSPSLGKGYSWTGTEHWGQHLKLWVN